MVFVADAAVPLRAGQAKDVEACLWKSVFYKPIEEFRRRIRKAHESGPAAAELLQKATKTLLGFLADAATFYKHLVMRLQVGADGRRVLIPCASALCGAQSSLPGARLPVQPGPSLALVPVPVRWRGALQ